MFKFGAASSERINIYIEGAFLMLPKNSLVYENKELSATAHVITIEGKEEQNQIFKGMIVDNVSSDFLDSNAVPIMTYAALKILLDTFFA